jgi:hypothetical protein
MISAFWPQPARRRVIKEQKNGTFLGDDLHVFNIFDAATPWRDCTCRLDEVRRKLLDKLKMTRLTWNCAMTS